MSENLIIALLYKLQRKKSMNNTRFDAELQKIYHKTNTNDSEIDDLVF